MSSNSNYPNGFLGGLTVRGMPITLLHPGNIFWVNNSSVLPDKGIGGSNGNKGTYHQPFSTIDYAIGNCKASRGDIVAVMPGHAETIAGAAGVTSDVAGVAIVGLGTGSLRPQITFSATASTWSVTAANLTFYNLQFIAGIAEVVTMHNVAATADCMSWENCWWTEGTGFNWVNAVTMATGADNSSWVGCKAIGADANNDAWITGVAHDGFYMDNCYVAANVAQAAAHGLIDSSGNMTNVEIKNSSFRSNIDAALWVDFNGAANGGVIKNCVVSSLDIAGATSTGDFSGGHFFECYVSGEANAFGVVGGGGVVYNDA